MKLNKNNKNIEMKFHLSYNAFGKRSQRRGVVFGFSVFLNEDLTKDYEDYIFKMQQAGFQGIFTSIHIPEDEVNGFCCR